MVRLHPPGNSEWFLELLTVPPSASERGKHWTRLETEDGHFGLCSFGYLALTDFEPVETDMGIHVARPEMMALANLLEHPAIGPETMSGLVAAREIKRSNKDLGRVVALAHLATERNEDVLIGWPKRWEAALRARFPEDWTRLACQVGSGLRDLLDSEADLDEARHTLVNGLLASLPPTIEVLRAAGERLWMDAIAPLESAGSRGTSRLANDPRPPKR